MDPRRPMIWIPTYMGEVLASLCFLVSHVRILIQACSQVTLQLTEPVHLTLFPRGRGYFWGIISPSSQRGHSKFECPNSALRPSIIVHPLQIKAAWVRVTDKAPRHLVPDCLLNVTSSHSLYCPLDKRFTHLFEVLQAQHDPSALCPLLGNLPRPTNQAKTMSSIE